MTRHLLFASLYTAVFLCVYFLLQPILDLDTVKRSQYQLYLSRLWLLTGVFHLAFTILSRRMELRTVSKEFFFSEGSSFNLAFFRIIYFAFVGYGLLATLMALGLTSLSSSEFAPENFIWPDLEKSARISLPFMDWYILNVPITHELAKKAIYLLLASGFLSMIGLFTRISTLVHVVAAFYILGIPNFFGKVNHWHYQVWFPLVFALSPCADKLSLDAILWKRKSPDRAVQYGFPIKLIWIIMGTIYFFPGFWKLWNGGFDWAFRDNLLHQIHFKWITLEEWKPLFRIDNYPYLLRMSAFGVIIWELLFIVMIFRPATRLIAAIEGLLFHFSTWAFMNIVFMGLVFCYSSFVDWEKLLQNIGLLKKKVKPKNLSPSIKSIMPVSLAAGFIVVMNLTTGFGHIVSWPFACFPTFEAMVGNRTQVLQYYSHDSNQINLMDKSKLMDLMSPERYRALEHRVILSFPQDSSVYKQTLQTIADIWIKRFPDELSDSLVIYLDKIPISPDSTTVVLQRNKVAAFSKKELLKDLGN